MAQDQWKLQQESCWLLVVGSWLLVAGAWRHVEAHVFDVARFVEEPGALGEALDMVL
jgi:hypothetical protein